MVAATVPATVAVFESHCHALEHVHARLRQMERSKLRRKASSSSTGNKRRRRKVAAAERDGGDDGCDRNDRDDGTATTDDDGGWSMLHFDAHPDLACPCGRVVPAAACFRPNDEFDVAVAVAAVAAGGREGAGEGKETEQKQMEKKEEMKKMNLYEMLDSTSTGMAEWILPLVLAAGLSRVEWVRCRSVMSPAEKGGCPDSSSAVSSCRVDGGVSICDDGGDFDFDHQDVTTFPLGEHEYRVGVWVPPPQPSSSSSSSAAASSPAAAKPAKIESFADLPDAARVKVDWDCPYYCDDDVDDVEGGCSSENEGGVSPSTAYESFAPRGELHLERPLSLRVDDDRSIDSKNNASAATQRHLERRRRQRPWMLDICLDYFACLNPFLADLEAADRDFARALRRAVRESRFYCAPPPSVAAAATTRDDRRQGLRRFRRELARLLNALLAAVVEGSGDGCGNRGEGTDGASGAIVESLSLNFYAPREEFGTRLLQSLVDSFEHFAARERETETVRKLVDDAVQALPYVMLPHHPPPAGVEASADATIQRRLNGIRDLLVSRRSEAKGEHESAPFLITVARSAREGFTPPGWVEDLQARVLEMLHEVYCCNEGGSCRGLSVPAVPVGNERTSCNNGDDGTNAILPRGRDFSSCCVDVVFDYGPWEGNVVA